MMSDEVKVVDITPTPRILRVLGEIPFAPWQCLAELIDNSIDAFLSCEEKGKDVGEQRINITWSNDSVAATERTVEITDNALGCRMLCVQAIRAMIPLTILDCLEWDLI